MNVRTSFATLAAAVCLVACGSTAKSGTTTDDTTSTEDTADATGTDATGTDAMVNDSAGTDAMGTDAAGTDAAGTDAAGTDASGTDATGTDAAGTDATGGTDAVAEVSGPTTIEVQVGGSSAAFTPKDVKIKVGDTVKWTWGGNFHNVVSGTNGTADNKFCSPTDKDCANAATSDKGATYSHTFTSAGSFPYFCAIHFGMGMTGSVTVE